MWEENKDILKELEKRIIEYTKDKIRYRLETIYERNGLYDYIKYLNGAVITVGSYITKDSEEVLWEDEYKTECELTTVIGVTSNIMDTIDEGNDEGYDENSYGISAILNQIVNEEYKKYQVYYDNIYKLGSGEYKDITINNSGYDTVNSNIKQLVLNTTGVRKSIEELLREEENIKKLQKELKMKLNQEIKKRELESIGIDSKDRDILIELIKITESNIIVPLKSEIAIEVTYKNKVTNEKRKVVDYNLSDLVVYMYVLYGDNFDSKISSEIARKYKVTGTNKKQILI